MPMGLNVFKFEKDDYTCLSEFNYKHYGIHFGLEFNVMDFGVGFLPSGCFLKCIFFWF